MTKSKSDKLRITEETITNPAKTLEAVTAYKIEKKTLFGWRPVTLKIVNGYGTGCITYTSPSFFNIGKVKFVLDCLITNKVVKFMGHKIQPAFSENLNEVRWIDSKSVRSTSGISLYATHYRTLNAAKEAIGAMHPLKTKKVIII